MISSARYCLRATLIAVFLSAVALLLGAHTSYAQNVSAVSTTSGASTPLIAQPATPSISGSVAAGSSNLSAPSSSVSPASSTNAAAPLSIAEPVPGLTGTTGATPQLVNPAGGITGSPVQAPAQMVNPASGMTGTPVKPPPQMMNPAPGLTGTPARR